LSVHLYSFDAFYILPSPLPSHLCSSFFVFFFFLLLPPPPSSPLFPYTTLFRSRFCDIKRRVIIRMIRHFRNILNMFHGIVAIEQDRKSTRLNSRHVSISYAVFCLKKKNKKTQTLPNN